MINIGIALDLILRTIIAIQKAQTEGRDITDDELNSLSDKVAKKEKDLEDRLGME